MHTRPQYRSYPQMAQVRRTQHNRTYVASHASGAVIYRMSSDGTVEFLLIEYTVNGEKTLRCIMGKQDSRQESPTDTLHREVEQEAVDPAYPFRCEFADRPILTCELVPDQEDSRGFHLKIFQLVTLVDGVLRTKDLQDDSGRFPELLGPPQWIEAEIAIRRMASEVGGKWAHIQAIKTALIALMSRDRKVSYKYASVAQEFCEGIEIKPPAPMAMEYLKRFE